MTYKDIKLQQKLTYLRRLLNVRVRLTKFVQGVEVMVEEPNIIIRWNIHRKERFFDFEEKEFPIKDLGKVVQYYKRKVGTEFKNRNKNRQS